MEITFLGHASFRIKTKTAVVVTDPYDAAMLGLKFPKLDADIVTVSHHHGDHDNVANITNVKRIVDGPGEYEIAGVSVIGVQSFHDDKKGAERGKNTIYVFEIEGLRLVHFGDLGHKLDESQVKEIGRIDIAMVPVGGSFTVDAKTALEVVKQIGPSIIIPMHYKMDGMNPQLAEKLLPVDEFLKEAGLRTEKLPKLVVKEGDIKSDEEYVVVLEKK